MDTDDLKSFLLVLEHGSFQAAAEASGIPRSSLRRRIENLESALGPLLTRQNTGIVPTPSGRLVAMQGRLLVQGATALQSAVRRMETELHVYVPVGVPMQVMAFALQIVRERLPHVRIQWRVFEDPVHALGAPDLILHFGAIPTSGNWISTTLYRAPERLVASEAYIEEYGMPQTVADLERHALLVWRPPGEDPELLPLFSGASIRVVPQFVSADVHFLRMLAAQGLGIAFVPDGGLPEVDPSVRLCHVLAGVVGREQAFKALIPDTVATLPTGERLLDLLRELATLLGEGG